MSDSGGAPEHEITDNTAGDDDNDADLNSFMTQLITPSRGQLLALDDDEDDELQESSTQDLFAATPAPASASARNSEPSESLKSDGFASVAEVRPFSAVKCCCK